MTVPLVPWGVNGKDAEQLGSSNQPRHVNGGFLNPRHACLEGFTKPPLCLPLGVY